MPPAPLACVLMRTDLDDLIGTEDAALVLGVTGKSVRRWCEDGTLAAKLVGGAYVMRKADVDAFAAERGGRP